MYFLKDILKNSNDLVTILAICPNNIPKSLPILLLDNIMREFLTYKQTNSSNIEFKIKFNQIIKFQIQQFNSNLINQSSNELNNLKYLLNNNIEQVMERNERIQLLVNKTDNLNTLSSTFKSNSTRVKRKFWWQNVKFWVFLSVSAVLVFIVFLEILFH